MDTVHPGEVEEWKYPPFGQQSGIIKADKLIGLGASDNKSSIAVLLKLAEWIKNNPQKIDVWFTFVVKEEQDGSGTKSFLEWFEKNGFISEYKQTSAVVFEPRNNKEITLGNKGNIFVKLKVKGDSGHSANKNKIKVNAIQEGVKILKLLEDMETELKSEYIDPELGYTTIAITGFEAKCMSPNKIPGICVISLDIRTIEQTHNKVLNTLISKLKDFEVSLEWSFKSTHPAKTAVSSEIVSHFKSVQSDLIISYSNTSNDACYFISKGIPTVVFGPGNKEQSHKVNEYVELKKLDQCFCIMKNVIKGVNHG